MTEIKFNIGEDELDDGFSASAPRFGVHTQGDNLGDLRRNVCQAVGCVSTTPWARPAWSL